MSSSRRPSHTQTWRAVPWWLAGAGLGLFALGCLGWQAFTWLKFGYWPDYDLRDLVEQPVRSKWLGVNEIFYWFGRWPVWLAGLLVSWGLFTVGNEEEARKNN